MNDKINGAPIANTLIETFQCPSDTHARFAQDSGYNHYAQGALSNYGFSIGNQVFSICGQGGNMFGTGSAKLGDSMDPGQISGVFSSMHWAAGIHEITDGTANTIAMGEIRPDCSEHLWSGWLHVNSFWIGTTGEINYRNVFKHLQAKGYQGVICMEHGQSLPGKEGERAVIEAYRACDDF